MVAECFIQRREKHETFQRNGWRAHHTLSATAGGGRTTVLAGISSLALLQVLTPGSVRITCGNAGRGPYLMQIIPQKYAYGAEIGP